MELTGVACLPVYGVTWPVSLMSRVCLRYGDASQRWLLTKGYIAVPESVYGTGL